MAEIEQVKLSEFFHSVKKPRYVLGSTYTLSLAFFESVVYSCIDRHALKYCLIVSDSHGYHRAMDEGAALQGAAQGYMVVPAPTPGCFHAKVWLLIGESEAALLVGSGNLTQSGFMTNAELFDSLHFSKDTPPTREQFSAITSFLSGLAGMWPDEDRTNLLCVDMLAEIRREFGAFARTDPPGGAASPLFIHSFDGPLISQMPEPSGPTKLYVAAPFFGNSTKGLDLLSARIRPNATYIFPAVHGGDAVDLPVREVRTRKKTSVARLTVKSKKTFAHLKLYGIVEASRQAWLCCTSANCTEAAWRGPNVEAGLLRSVSPETVSAYFIADKKPLPEGSLEYTPDAETGSRLHLWASESGMGFDVTVSSTCANRLPLQQIALTVRVGSNTCTAKRNAMFTGKRTEHVLWPTFQDLKRPPNMAICLELNATDCAGNPVKGACFVENRMILTADPLHRSAWRGALTLLDTGRMPDLSDIAAIFTLVTNIFDGRLVCRSPGSAATTERPSEEDNAIHVPIWPPQPDNRDLHRQIGTTGMGQLALCQKILATLLKPQAPPSASNGNQSSLDESEGDESDKAQAAKAAQHLREEEKGRISQLAQLLWDRAGHDYDRLYARLHSFEPTPEVAPNIWPAASFVFLATTAVHRATSRISPILQDKVEMWQLVSQFVTLMLNDRVQPDDFCCSKGMRYRSETFQPLADDLWRTFQVMPDPDIATVMVAVLVAHKMRIAPNNEYPIKWQRYLNQVVGSDFQPSEDFAMACRRIWSQYLHEETDLTTEKDFDAAYVGMWQAYRGSAT